MLSKLKEISKKKEKGCSATSGGKIPKMLISCDGNNVAERGGSTGEAEALPAYTSLQAGNASRTVEC